MDHVISIDDQLWRKARDCVEDAMTDSEIITLALTTFVRLKAMERSAALDGAMLEIPRGWSKK